jgi:hypothetical protein
MRSINMRVEDWDGVEKPELTNEGIKAQIKRIEDMKI